MKETDASGGIHPWDSYKSGPVVSIFAGIHGNEKAGVYALESVMKKIKLKRGGVYFAFGNPPAIEANKRFVGKNLNRCFVKDQKGKEYEDGRARLLMSALDTSDALLDIHAFNDPEGEPFVICETPSLEIAKKMDVPIISTNWTEAEPGAADGYMHEMGKLAVCLECGPIVKSVEYTDLAVKSILQFLKYFDIIDTDVEYSKTPKQVIRASHSVKRVACEYFLKPDLKNFEELTHGEMICKQGDTYYYAEAGDRIIFPRYDPPIGAEAFLIGHLQE